jgi:hypothetical protein
MGTSVRVTSDGHPYARFRRALDTGNPDLALAAAHDLKSVPLSNALELVLLLATAGGDRFRRAAVRWHSRFCREIRDVTADEAQAVLALLLMLDGPRGRLAAQALGELIYRPLLRQECEALIAWASS